MTTAPTLNRALVTGGAGFIGSNLVRLLVDEKGVEVINVDKLTYAGNLAFLRDLEHPERHAFLKADVCDRKVLKEAFARHRPDAVFHLAAESHVDRSIDAPADFVSTNVLGTFSLLEEARIYWESLENEAKQRFRFINVSTDEVYGSLGEDGLFTESSRYNPSSPYSASKAAADHFVRAYRRTYGLPTIVTTCSNNYGPHQFPEKLIPLMITSALGGEPLPVYGRGENIRDWIYVGDHVQALWTVATKGRVGQTYNIGGHEERRNLDVVKTVCEHLEAITPAAQNSALGGRRYEDLIVHVTDRPGHDFRYALDSTKIENELGFRPRETFDSGIRKTIEWYLANTEWVSRMSTQSHRSLKRN